MAEERTSRHRGSGGAFDPSAFVAVPSREGDRTPSGELHVCGNCSSELVYPVEWEPAGRNRWSVTVRCPDCEWQRCGVHDQAAVDRFDEALDVGTEALLDDLTTLTRANMQEQVEGFVAALWANQVMPEDF
jgi:hypothetical protein